jgi:hypothetical protein
MQESPSGIVHHRRASADFFGASSVASALGIRSRRDPETDKRGARRRSPNRNATEVSAPEAADLSPASLTTKSLPKEDLGIPRRLVDRRCGSSASAILDFPAWGATPRRSVSDYDKEEKPGALGYFLT